METVRPGREKAVEGGGQGGAQRVREAAGACEGLG
jgi:hypothetical protein